MWVWFKKRVLEIICGTIVIFFSTFFDDSHDAWFQALYGGWLETLYGALFVSVYFIILSFYWLPTAIVENYGKRFSKRVRAISMGIAFIICCTFAVFGILGGGSLNTSVPIGMYILYLITGSITVAFIEYRLSVN